MIMDLVYEILQMCLIPLIGVLVAFVAKYLNTKRKEILSTVDNETAQKYINMIFDTVDRCVVVTNQTYTETLKESGQFDEAAQKEAFQKTYDAVASMLSEEAVNYINTTFGDVGAYLTQLIEASVNKNK